MLYNIRLFTIFINNCNMKILFSLLFFISSLFASAEVVVHINETTGAIKPMNAVNNGPKKEGADQTIGNFDAYKSLHIPYARIHDASFCATYGGEHTVDVMNIFPDFSKKVDDSKAYDFTLTDVYMQSIQDAGAKVFFRLGQRIEHAVKKYGIYPPKDFKKWAQICEHIIRHYTEGWDNGYHYDMKYWEIWNEPDLDINSWNTNPRTWGGTKEQFFDLYATASKHLKACFPNLKIGGPALAGDEKWADEFLSYMNGHQVTIDFFSWHCYDTEPKVFGDKAERVRVMLNKYGYQKTESILNEWNYVEGWSDKFKSSLIEISSLKGAAFSAAIMSLCQNKPVDMLMYYDARIGTGFNGLFDAVTLESLPTYYAFYTWRKLTDLGTQLKTSVDEKDIYAVAATNKKGSSAIMLTRYCKDNNVATFETVTVSIDTGLLSNSFAYITDAHHLYTEVPIEACNGKLNIKMAPNSVAFIILNTN